MVSLPSWLGGSSTPAASPSTPPKSSDGGYIAPDRSKREVCYDARDAFFACLDKNSILDSVREDDKAKALCGKELADFEGACARSWIKYFKEKRVVDYKRDQTIAQIQRDDAAAVEKAKQDRKGKGWLG